MEPDPSFWQSMSELLFTNSIIVDRPKGTTHPRWNEMIYPLDYGYLENTTSCDGGGIDVWIGSLSTMTNDDRSKILTGILCTFDRLERDAEIKLLIGCSKEDIQVLRDFHQEMHALFIPSPMVDNDVSK